MSARQVTRRPPALPDLPAGRSGGGTTQEHPVPSMTPLRPVLTTTGDRYAVAAIVVQENPGDPAALTELASRLAEEARRLLQEERPDATVQAAVAVSTTDEPAPAVVVEPEPPAAATSSGDIEVDRRAYRAWAGGRDLDLSFREFELLAFLVEHQGRVFSRRQLVSSVWEGAAVGARTVDVHVRRLRVKLGAAADRITTIRNVGYRLEPAPAGHPDLETVA